MTEFTTSPRHHSKVVAAWLACLFGVFGAHWWYMGHRWAWAVTVYSVLMIVLMQFYPVWWDNPPFLLLILPAGAGYIYALVYALTPDEKFDARYNAGSPHSTKTGWDAVLVAIFTTFFGSTVLMAGLAITVMHVYTAMGWLDNLAY